jgi:hypothetical protein
VDGNKVYIERPQILTMGTSTVLFGSPTLTYDTVSEFVVPWLARNAKRSWTDLPVGIQMRPGHAPAYLRPPALKKVMRLPRAVIDQQSMLHVVWGESDDDAPARIAALWYARFDGTWSRPVEIIRRPGLRWNTTDVSDLVVYKEGLAIAVATTGMAEGSLLLLQRAGVNWKSRFITVPHWGASTPRIVFSGNQFTLAFTADANVRNATWQPNVFTMRSLDRGATWSEPVPIAPAGAVPSYSPQLVVLQPKATLGLVWLRASAQGRANMLVEPQQSGIDTVMVAFSNDEARAWRLAMRLPVLGGTDAVTAVVSEQQGLVVAMRAWQKKKGPLVAQQSAGSWRIDTIQDTASIFTQTQLGIASGGRTLAAWGVGIEKRRPWTLLTAFSPRAECLP